MQTIRCYKLSEVEATHPVVAFYADTDERAGIFPTLYKCVNVLLGKRTRYATHRLVGALRKDGKPKTVGAKGKRRIYIQYLEGEFKKDFGINGGGKYCLNNKLNPVWSNKNPNLKKMANEYKKKRNDTIKRKRSFEAMTGAIVTK